MHAACSPSGWKPATTCGDGVRWGTRSSWCAWPMAARPSSGWRSSWTTCTRASCACAGAIHSMARRSPRWKATAGRRAGRGGGRGGNGEGGGGGAGGADGMVRRVEAGALRGKLLRLPAAARPAAAEPAHRPGRHQHAGAGGRVGPGRCQAGFGAAAAGPLLDTVVYRLAQAGGEARSPALALDGAVYSRLRLRTSGPVSVLGATPPTIAVGATPRTLVFLAQGGAPFSLAWSAVAGKGAVQ